jgi:4-hydroxythreonine-4-phosphate dehydrogenase
VTAGDPRGIGPEVLTAAAASLAREDPSCRLRMVGPASVLGSLGDSHEIEDLGDWDPTEVGAGRVAGRGIEVAARLALDGEVDGIVTAPIHKVALRRAGYRVPGHTEMLQELSRAPTVGMLMAAERTRLGGPLRVLLATTHLALREVPGRLDETLLVEQTALLHESLRRGWGLEQPDLALCALNPHASDGGLFGDEEARIYGPARDRLARRGIDVPPPLPADTVFSRAVAGEFDAVVAPYHDVGMAAFKTVSFGQGVNVTLGLPFVRTSPDHGTAFDRVGTGTADPSSMLEALRLAARLARGRRAAPDGSGPEARDEL